MLKVEKFIKDLHIPIVISKESDDYSYSIVQKIADAKIVLTGDMGFEHANLIEVDEDVLIYKVSSSIKELSSPPQHDFHSDHDEWCAVDIVTTVHPKVYNYYSKQELYFFLCNAYFAHNEIFNDDNVELDEIDIKIEYIKTVSEVSSDQYVNLF